MRGLFKRATAPTGELFPARAQTASLAPAPHTGAEPPGARALKCRPSPGRQHRGGAAEGDRHGGRDRRAGLGV